MNPTMALVALSEEGLELEHLVFSPWDIVSYYNVERKPLPDTSTMLSVFPNSKTVSLCSL